MTRRIYVIDTGYLLELFEVPGASVKSSITEVKRRFTEAIKRSHGLYVPFTCLCELGNRIAQVPDGNIRRKLALNLYHTIKTSLDDGNPWIITPNDGMSSMKTSCIEFAETYCERGIGLTDTVVIHEAIRLYKKYSSLGYKVHIWTKDGDLKALEPQCEEDAFLG